MIHMNTYFFIILDSLSRVHMKLIVNELFPLIYEMQYAFIDRALFVTCIIT